MAAVPASQPEQFGCAFCQQPLEGRLAPHLCGSCGRPQPLQASSDYFTALDAPKRFAQDVGALEKRFYELSRALHPDRFGQQREAQKQSLERMSWLNQAYSTLKNVDERRAYLLEVEGLGIESSQEGAKSGASKVPMPMELAEAWFELQDALTEDPATARAKVNEFESQLQETFRSAHSEVSALETDYDRAPRREPLEELRKKLLVLNYLKSLQRDLGRVRDRLK